nr:MAG TPA: hypothetical protein [Caudoviricetes sp.]
MCDKSIKYNEIIMPYLLVTMTWDTIYSKLLTTNTSLHD